MYWFRIFYYEKGTAHCKPMTNNEEFQLLVYAATPQQASEAAWEVINDNFDDDSQHLSFIGTLGSHVVDEDLDKWHRDMRKTNV